MRQWEAQHTAQQPHVRAILSAHYGSAESAADLEQFDVLTMWEMSAESSKAAHQDQVLQHTHNSRCHERA